MLESGRIAPTNLSHASHGAMVQVALGLAKRVIYDASETKRAIRSDLMMRILINPK